MGNEKVGFGTISKVGSVAVTEVAIMEPMLLV